MMTGIPIENSLWTAYLLTIFFVVAGFAVYDVLYRRVPDRALVFFIPLAALAPVLQGYFLLNHGLPPLFLWPVATHALVTSLLPVRSYADGTQAACIIPFLSRYGSATLPPC